MGLILPGIGAAAGLFNSGVAALSEVNYIGQVGGKVYTNAAIGTAQSDRLVVVVLNISGLFAPVVSSVDVAGTNLTNSTATVSDASGADLQTIKIWYGVVAAGTTATITATMTNDIAVIMSVYTVYGSTSTPLDQVTQASENDTTINLNDIQIAIGGAVIAIGLRVVNTGTMSGAWTGSDTPIEDYDVAGAASNSHIAGYHFATTQATTTDDLTITLSSGNTHIGAAISFGP